MLSSLLAMMSPTSDVIEFESKFIILLMLFLYLSIYDFLLLLLGVAETVYHSSGVLSSLSSSWSSKPPLAVKYRLDTSTLDSAVGSSKSLCSTLERLLAWEKKLYEEVKVIIS